MNSQKYFVSVDYHLTPKGRPDKLEHPEVGPSFCDIKRCDKILTCDKPCLGFERWVSDPSKLMYALTERPQNKGGRKRWKNILSVG